MERINRESLQSRNLNRLFVVPMHHAGAFAQHLHWTGSGTTPTQNICIENSLRRASQIAAGNLLDETWHINMRRTSGCARSVETIETAIRFRHRCLSIKRRVQVAEALRDLGWRRNLLMKWNSRAHRGQALFL
jgi:hypothetical protein